MWDGSCKLLVDIAPSLLHSVLTAWCTYLRFAVGVKVRYESRKRLAESRPRVGGKFMKRGFGGDGAAPREDGRELGGGG